MSLSKIDKAKLKLGGFLAKEIEQLDKATVNQYSDQKQNFDLNSEPMRRIITTRRNYIDNLRKGSPGQPGLTNLQIGHIIWNFYNKNKDMSVFDFLQWDYYKTRGAELPSDFNKKAKQTRAIRSKLGRKYGSKPGG